MTTTAPVGIVNISLAEKDQRKVNFGITQALQRLQTISSTSIYTPELDINAASSSTNSKGAPLLVLRNISAVDGGGPGILFNCSNSTGIEHTAAYINGGYFKATAGSECGLFDFSVYDGANTANRIITQAISTDGSGGTFAPGTDDNYWLLGESSLRWKKLYSYAGDFSTGVTIGGPLTLSTGVSANGTIAVNSTGPGAASFIVAAVSTSVNAEIVFYTASTPKWEMGKDTSNQFFIFDDASGTNAVTIGSNGGLVTFSRTVNFFQVPIEVGNFTVATLPIPNTGMVARVSDGVLGAAWGSTVSGSSGTQYLLWYNGSNWTVVGK